MVNTQIWKLWQADKWGSNPFEKYVKNNASASAAINKTPDKPTFSAPVYVTDFWDKNLYTGSNPTDGKVQGLAEYTNANYFSTFTIPFDRPSPKHQFPYPQITNANYICTDKLPKSGEITKYVSRETCPTGGNPVDHFAAISLLNKKGTLVSSLKKVWLDDNVHDTYAQTILPRAVGYSSALLDYFFRGKIDLTVATPSDITFRNIKITTSNSTTGETMGLGDVSLVIRYKALSEISLSGGKYLLNFPLPTAEYSYKVVTLNSVNMASTQTLNFDFSSDPLPMNFDDMTMQLVFKGKLGNEDGAVAVSQPAVIDGIYTDFVLSLPSSGVYAKTSDSSPNATFSELRVNAKTDIPGGLSGGSISLALEYRTAIGDQFQSLLVDTNPIDAAGYVIKAPAKNGVNTLPQGVPVELVFDLSSLQLPVQATDVELNIVYTKADGTVQAIGVRNISEPTPVDVFNNTDYTCLNGQWYKYDDPAAMAIVDSNGDGIADKSDIYPHTINNISFLAGPADATSLDASIYSTLFATDPLPTGQILRLGYILTDYANRYAINEIRTGQNGDPWPHVATNNRIFPGTGFRNDATSWSSMFTFRQADTKMWWGTSVIFNNKEYNGTCTWDALNQKLGL